MFIVNAIHLWLVLYFFARLVKLPVTRADAIYIEQNSKCAML